MNNNSLSFIYAFSGIYNHSLYLGSTNDIQRREKEHLSALEWGRHYNEHLQAAHDCFGPDNFTMIVVATAKNDDDRKQKEVQLIKEKANDKGIVVCNKTLSTGNTKSGYKLSEETRERQSKAQSGIKRPVQKTKARLYRFIAPDGSLVESLGLRFLCDKYALNLGHLSRVASGRLKQHKGWKAVATKIT